jgi:tetratricopeptide (TPR) repeat protein
MVFRWMAVAIALIALSSTAWAASTDQAVRVDQARVDKWNRFADRLYQVHLKRIAAVPVRTESHVGSYGGDYAAGFHFIETSYFDRASGRLLDRVRVNKAKPKVIHTIELNFYDHNGRVIRDYTAAYLPNFHNAPYQTLIDLYSYHGKLKAFRQWDASGEVLREQCEGSYMGKDVSLSYEDYEMPTDPMHESGVYLACFAALPKTAGKWLNPLSELSSGVDRVGSAGSSDGRIAALSARLQREPRNAALHADRGDALFAHHDFEHAVADYSAAIRIDPRLDRAWFGRGMALGREGKLDPAIADLSVYLQRHPHSSVGFTKRGIRKVWKGDLRGAKRDLEKAIALDATNSEAHDDLGVLFARRHEYERAIENFRIAIRHDSSYAKAYHNLALTYYLTAKRKRALKFVNDALALDPKNRNSLLLKATLLADLGSNDQAHRLRAEANQLPAGNWTERLSLD